jgi:phage shock protein A
MNIGERFARLVKSNVNQLISNMEDPEKVLEQAMTDMQKDLVQVRQSYAEVMASSKRLEEQAKVADADAAKWYDRAQLAVEKGEDDLAKEALTRRQQMSEKAGTLADQVEAQKGSLTALYDSMKDLEAKIAEAKAKKDSIIARAKTAKAATKVNDMLANVGTTSSTAAFDRMTEKVEQLEATADVSKQMAATSGSGKALGSGSVEDRFAQLEAGTDVDSELKALKASVQQQLPAPKDDDK